MRHMNKAYSLLALLCLLALSSCTRTLNFPDLGNLYNQAAKSHGPDRNPIIVMPGILGSKLKQKGTDKNVWGTFFGEFVNPNTAENVRILSLPMSIGSRPSELIDDVVPNGVLDTIKVKVLGIPLAVSAYTDILVSLGAGGYRDQDFGKAGAIDYGKEHYTCFQFGYDWRRSISESAIALHNFILDKQRYVKAENEKRFGKQKKPVRFDIVAHSMGGLVLRYYLRYGTQELPADGSLPELTWEGKKHIDKVVLIGTPSAGSLDSLSNLVDGANFGFFLPNYPPSILGTYSSLYQLLPRTRHGMVQESKTGEKVDLFDPKLWEEMEWGLADPQEEKYLRQMLPEVPSGAQRRAIALEHQAKMLAQAEQLHRALDQPAEPPESLKYFLIAGDAADTSSLFHLDKEKRTLKKVKSAPGDSIVLRSSALMDERLGRAWSPKLNSPIEWDRVMFLFDDHIGMTKDPVFTDNLLFYLLEKD